MTQPVANRRSLLAEMLAPDDPAERRAHPRHERAPRIASLASGGLVMPCLVRNVSNGGMMASVLAPIEIGAAVEVRFREGLVLTGMIAWAVESRIGIRFDNPVDALALLHD